MSDELYAIVDLEGYVQEMRQAAASSLSDSDTDDLNNYISVNQMINLVKNECLGYDDNDRPMLNEDANCKIYESTVAWIHNVGLAKLAAQDLIECAWDSELSEMIFWSKTKEKKHNGKRKSRRKNMGDQK
jgi:hypothetical protein